LITPKNKNCLGLIIGQDEVDGKILTIKNMITGEQVKGSVDMPVR